MRNLQIIFALITLLSTHSMAQVADFLVKFDDTEVSDICLGDNNSVTVSFEDLSTAQTGIANWSWNFGDGVTETNTSGDITHDYTESGEYTIQLEILDNEGGIYNTEKTIYIHGIPDVNFFTRAESEELISTFRMEFIFDSAGFEFNNRIEQYTFNWDFGDNTTADTIASLPYTYSSAGIYTVELTASLNTSECANSISKVINVVDALDTLKTASVETLGTIFPTAFSPNNDGKNDYWIIKSNGVTELTASIFSRNGTMVYHHTSTTIVWDGKTDSGQECSPGIYYYVVETNDPAYSPAKGFFYLFR